MSSLVGQVNEAEITIDDNLVSALLDTGANISTVSQGFFTKMYPDAIIKPLEDFKLDIKCAGDQSLPYIGYVEVDVGIPRVVDPISCLLLVTYDTQYGAKVPVILGTNVLEPLMTATEKMHGPLYHHNVHMPDAVYFSFRCMKLQSIALHKSSGQLCVVKCAMASKVIIPENTSMIIQGQLDKKVCSNTQLGITQPCAQSMLPDGVSVTPILIDGSSTILPIEISNLTQGPVAINSNAILCQVQSCQLELDSQTVSESDQPTKPSKSALELVDLSPANLTAEEKFIATKLVSDFEDVFSTNDMDVGLTSLVKHNIHLNNYTPFKQRYRKIPPAMFAEVQQHIKQLLEAKIIRHSQSSWASNIVLVRKKDSSLRVCVDYRQLNLRTVKDAYALPRIDDILEGLGGNLFYSVLDMRKGYHQVELQEDHTALTAFTLGPLGFFEYNRLPLGLSNAPATYQRLMEQIMQDIIMDGHRFCQIYLDDVIVVSKSFEEHIKHLTMILERIRSAGMKLSPKKCHLFRDKVRYVGHIVSAAGIEADPDKIEKVRNWPTPADADATRTFLGFSGYYRKFIKDYAKIAKPLNEILQDIRGKRKSRRRKLEDPDRKFKWEEAQQQAFDTLKHCLTSPPILTYPDYDKPFTLHTDASMNGLGAILYQEVDGYERVIAFASRGLSKSERNYPVHKLEFLALKWAITKKFSDYLIGNSFVVFTDNNPLTYVLRNAKLDATGHRWMAALSAYNFTIQYKSGKANSDADGLSRLPLKESTGFTEIQKETIRTLCGMQVVQPYIETLCMAANDVPGDIDLYSDIVPQDWRVHQRRDPIIGQFVQAVTNKLKPTAANITTKEGNVLLREFQKLVVQRGALYRKITDGDVDVFQLVLPSAFRKIAMRCAHNDMGHFGRERSTDVLRQRVYWPNMIADMQQWIRSCERCIRRKTPIDARAPLVSIHTTQPLELVCMDYLSLEMSKGGYQNILVISDHFTKLAIAIPTKNQTAKTTAEALFNGFIVSYGLPLRLHSDQGANFESQIISELCKLTGIAKTRTTPYHPMGNGIVERFNRTLLNMLGTLDPSQKSDWKSAIAPLVHAYNCTRHDSTGFTPYELMFGRRPRLAIDAVLGLIGELEQPQEYSEYIEKLKTRLDHAYNLASNAAKSSQQKQKLNYDKRERGAVVRTGDRVLVKIVAYDGKHKISDRWESDVYVIQDQPNQEVPVYIVRKEMGDHSTRTLHRNLLLPIGSLPLDGTDIPATVDTVVTAGDIGNSIEIEPEDTVSDEGDTSENDDYIFVVNEPDILEDQTSMKVVNGDAVEQTPLAPILTAPLVETVVVPFVDAPVQPDIVDPTVHGEQPIIVQSQTRKPVPAPRRSTRNKTKPKWMESGEFVQSQVATPSRHEQLNSNQALEFMKLLVMMNQSDN